MKVQLREEVIGIGLLVEISWDHCKLTGNCKVRYPLSYMGWLGVTLTSMAPVVLTVVGSKVIPQLVKGEGERVTAADEEILLTSLPMTITKGSVVMAGEGLTMPVIDMIAEESCVSEVKAPDIVTLLLMIEHVKVVDATKSSSRL